MTVIHRDAVTGMKATNNAYAAPSASEMMLRTSSITLSVSLHERSKSRAHSSTPRPRKRRTKVPSRNYQQYHHCEE